MLPQTKVESRVSLRIGGIPMSRPNDTMENIVFSDYAVILSAYVISR
jgi:hypothetical protein